MSLDELGFFTHHSLLDVHKNLEYLASVLASGKHWRQDDKALLEVSVASYQTLFEVKKGEIMQNLDQAKGKVQAAMEPMLQAYAGIYGMNVTPDVVAALKTAIPAFAFRQGKVKQDASNLSLLYQSASKLVVEFDSIMSAVASSCGCVYRAGGLKSLGRSIEKGVMRGSFQALTDLIRGALIIDNLRDGFPAALRAISQQDRLAVVSFVDTFTTFDKARGWADMKVYVTLDSDPSGLVCEIQLCWDLLWDARERFGGHTLYEVARSLNEVIHQKTSVADQLLAAIEGDIQQAIGARNFLEAQALDEKKQRLLQLVTDSEELERQIAAAVQARKFADADSLEKERMRILAGIQLMGQHDMQATPEITPGPALDDPDLLSIPLDRLDAKTRQQWAIPLDAPVYKDPRLKMVQFVKGQYPLFVVDNFLAPDEITSLLAFYPNNMPNVKHTQNSQVGRNYQEIRPMKKHTKRIQSKLAKFMGFDVCNMGTSEFIRYNGGEEFTAHYDTATTPAGRDPAWYKVRDGFVQPTTYYNWNRAITVILYLNDVDEGGETIFYDEHHREDVKIKPRKGRLLIMPVAPSPCETHVVPDPAFYSSGQNDLGKLTARGKLPEGIFAGFGGYHRGNTVPEGVQKMIVVQSFFPRWVDLDATTEGMKQLFPNPDDWHKKIGYSSRELVGAEISSYY